MKTKQSQKTQSAGCACHGAGPLLSEMVRRLGPPEEARRHFDAARLEFLKGLRALLDARIAHVSKPRGEKIAVE
jgi:hypothetical protein